MRVFSQQEPRVLFLAGLGPNSKGIITPMAQYCPGDTGGLRFMRFWREVQGAEADHVVQARRASLQTGRLCLGPRKTPRLRFPAASLAKPKPQQCMRGKEVFCFMFKKRDNSDIIDSERQCAEGELQAQLRWPRDSWWDGVGARLFGMETDVLFPQKQTNKQILQRAFGSTQQQANTWTKDFQTKMGNCVCSCRGCRRKQVAARARGNRIYVSPMQRRAGGNAAPISSDDWKINGWAGHWRSSWDTGPCHA